MRLAIMQPYFLPYPGYFQLLASCDHWVVLDNVNFRKGAFVQRNRIWLGHAAGWFGLPLQRPSQNRLICEHRVLLDAAGRAQRLRSVAQAYARAPCREEGLALAAAALPEGEAALVPALLGGLRAALQALGGAPEISLASAVELPGAPRGAARIIALCRHFGAREYLNLPGGRALYDPAAFAAAGLRLGFVEPALRPYGQGRAGFTPGLSILDLVMHVAPAERAAHRQPARIDWCA